MARSFSCLFAKVAIVSNLLSAAPSRDRVVHHAMIRVIEPLFEPKFIEPILDKPRPLMQISAMIFSAVITEAEEGGYVAFNPETGTTTQGESFDEAMANLREATELYLEVFPMKSKSPAVLTCFELSHAQAAGC